MNIGIGQILLTIIIVIFLFGNFSNIIKKLTEKLKVFKELLKRPMSKK
uniref:TatA n=1 Tax=Storeatula sp. CCMP1868 TaxID=195070 RepID=A0A2P1G8A1_9CRYP|nr:tatA [Storeatula sp. CCMP1868]AVM81163.1 tatA [Storeatula sp. CCMP1868]